MRSRRSLRILLAALAPPALLFASAAMFCTGGRGDFSPDTLESRSRTEILFFSPRLPIYRGRHETRRLPLVEYLITHGHWSPTPTADPRRIPTYHWNPLWKDGHTRFDRELSWHTDEWIAWTQRNPDVAKHFWPMLLEILREPRNDAADEAAHLLMLGRSAESPEHFDHLAYRSLGLSILPTSRPTPR
jgi:hypothetical protein